MIPRAHFHTSEIIIQVKNYCKILSKMILDAFKPFVIKPELQIDEKMF